jgi:hypothetical protein
VLQYRARLLAAIAARTGPASDLHRVVAITSLNPDAGKDSPAMGNGEINKSIPMLKLEPNPR